MNTCSGASQTKKCWESPPKHTAPVAQLDRAWTSYVQGCRFDPCRARQLGPGHAARARFAGSITVNGVTYVVATHEDGQPLVRQDVLMAEAKKKGEKK